MGGMRRNGATAAALGLLVLGLVRPTAAQQTARVARAGDRVRVTTCGRQPPPCRSATRVDGLLLAEPGDTLTVQVNMTTRRIPWTAVRRVDRYEGRHGAVRSFAFVFGGLVLGSVLGVTTGLLVQGDCYEAGCLAGPVYGFLVGAPVGLMAGITTAVLTRDRWRTVYDGPVRLTLGPAAGAWRLGAVVGMEIPLRR